MSFPSAWKPGMDQALRTMAAQGRSRDDIRAELNVSEFVIRREARRLGVEIRRANKADRPPPRPALPVPSAQPEPPPEPPKHHPYRAAVPKRSVFDVAREWLDGQGYSRSEVRKMTLGEILEAWRGRAVK